MEYRVRLSQFEGPLDLLLHLIESAQVDIKDIFVASITQQYLEYMSQLSELDMDTASEFLTMAATLVYIKSRSLLPKPPKEETMEEDPEVVLMRQLREYKEFKSLSAELARLLETSQGRYTRLREEVFQAEPPVSFAEGVPMELYAALRDALTKEHKENAAPHVHEVSAEQFTIRGEANRLREYMRGKSRVTFDELFDSSAPKLQIIIVFMALLDMIANREIRIRQSAPFEKITFYVNALIHDDENVDYMDEIDYNSEKLEERE
ncbi:MAG: segregation/condensation protein A [Bacillota bacterium]